MARPVKIGMDYFPHDTDASNDEKIDFLRSLYRNDGYAFYFILLERIYRSPVLEIDLSYDDMKKVMAKKVGVSLKRFLAIMNSSLSINLFSKSDFDEKGVLTSPAIKKRAEVVYSKRENERKKYMSRNGSNQNSEVGLQQKVHISASETNQENTFSDELPFRAKQNNKIQNKIKNHTPLSLQNAESNQPNQFESDSFLKNGEEFNNLWEKYGKPVGNKESIKKYYMKIPVEERKKILPHVEKYIQAYEPRFRKDLLNYLKLRAWNDEVFPAVNSPPGNGNEQIQSQIMSSTHPEWIARTKELDELRKERDESQKTKTQTILEKKDEN
jgi:hypothetical protein